MTSTTSSIYTPALSNGQIWIGNTGNQGLGPSAATLTPGTGISITNGAGSITISATGGGSNATVLPNPTASVSVTGNKTYIPTNVFGGSTNFTLPVSPNVGEFYQIIGSGPQGWKVSLNSGQVIQLGTAQTSAGGYIASNNSSDSVIIWCQSATFFLAIPSQGILFFS